MRMLYKYKKDENINPLQFQRKLINQKMSSVLIVSVRSLASRIVTD